MDETNNETWRMYKPGYDHTNMQNVVSFVATVAVYGKQTSVVLSGGKRLDNVILSREAAHDLLWQIKEHPERAAINHDGTLFAVKRVWLEETTATTGYVKVEYER